MEATDFLDRLFRMSAASTHAERLAMAYAEAGLGLGEKLYWPPLSEVWCEGAVPSPAWAKPAGRAQAWREARAFLLELHAEYEAARGSLSTKGL